MPYPSSNTAEVIQGERGPQGIRGLQGPQGERGIQGFDGEQGDQGDRGPIGPRGPMGLEGEQGPKGDTGPKGEKGDTGPAGKDGKDGQSISGPKGPKGDKGDSASFGELKGIVNSSIENHTKEFDHNLIDPFLVGTKTISETGMEDGQVITYEKGKLIYKTIPKSVTNIIQQGGGGTTLPSQVGNSGKFLTTSGSVLSWTSNAGGDVVGPASAVNNRVAFFDGITGKLIKDSGLTLSGINTGDQTSIVGITGTKAQFNTELSDGDFLFVGDITQYTDELAQDAVGVMLDTTLEYADVTPLLRRAALTGAITASAGSNATLLGSFTKAQLDAAVSDGNPLYVGDVTQYTDELAQDAIGAMVDGSLTYVDGTPLLQRAALTGDITASAGSNATTLATVNANVGSFGLAGSVAQFTVNAKGLITSAVNVAISITSAAVSDFASAVRSTVLTGLSLASTTVISATDTILVALGSLQAQITALTTVVSGKVESTRAINTTAPLAGGGDLSSDRTLTTSMATNKLIGRGTAGTGVMEEITLGTNLSLSGTTLNAAGGAGGSATETEVDFGSGTPVYEKKFTITDASVSVTSKIVVTQSGSVATDRVGDDVEWDSVVYAAKAGTGEFTLFAQALPGPLKGKRKLFYSIY